MSYNGPLLERIVFILIYRWKYSWAVIRSKFTKSDPKKNIDRLIYVARELDKNWIFGAKVRRLSRHSKLNADAYYHDGLRGLPKADAYYFIFPQYFCRAIRHNPHILKKRNIVMFTHENWTRSFSKSHVLWCLKKADKVICLNSQVKKRLIDLGLKPSQLEVIHMASNPNFFYPHNRQSGAVGFCSAYSKRKNPKLIYNLIKNMPEKQFILIGKDWEQYEHYDDMISSDNLTYFNNRDYSQYPDLYNMIDTFISPSFLEGGPVPLLEAMLSNCIPIATKTGFAPDIIKHGQNGFLIDKAATYKEVIPLIRQADKLNQVDIRTDALPYSWEACSLKIDNLFLSINNSQ